MTSDRRFCTFGLDGLLCGVEVQRLQEVSCAREITPVPRAATVIAGVINLRGEIIPVVDLRRRLELPERRAGQMPMNVVVRTDDGAVSLLVDEIYDVQDVTEDCFEYTPETLRGVARELTQGVYNLDDRPLLVLDVDRTVDVASAAMN